MASITIKTPKRSINLTSKKEEKIKFFNEIEKNISKVCLGALSESVAKAYEDEIAILSVFFQRVVARTPLDENYDRVIVTSKGEKVVHHKPDKEICREHWFIEETSKGGKFYSKELISNGKFEVVNNSEEINEIKAKMKSMFPLKNFADGKPSFVIGNDCRHFDRIEFGYSEWKSDSQPVIGEEVGREHGVKNKHSVQAPAGMLRITEMELESIRRKNTSGNLRRAYRGGYKVNVTPSDKKLTEFYELLKKKHRVKYADIKRYVEVY